MVLARWEIPEGLRVLPDGTWRVGELHVLHPQGLRYLKTHLVFGEDGPVVVDGSRRMPITIEGPAFHVTRLVIDAEAEQARVILDDESVEPVGDHALGMAEATGRFECSVKSGRARALLTRNAHQTLLDNAVEEGGRFFLVAGARRIPLRT